MPTLRIRSQGAAPNVRGITLTETLVSLVLLGIFFTAVLVVMNYQNQKTHEYRSMEDQFSTIVLPIDTVKNDLRYAETVAKIPTGGYVFTFKQYQDTAAAFKPMSIEYTLAPDGVAPDGTPNVKIVRTLRDLTSWVAVPVEFSGLAGVKWCVDGLDLPANCPATGKIATTVTRFIVEFTYRTGLGLKKNSVQTLVADVANAPFDGGGVNPLLLRP